MKIELLLEWYLWNTGDPLRHLLVLLNALQTMNAQTEQLSVGRCFKGSFFPPQECSFELQHKVKTQKKKKKNHPKTLTSEAMC